MIPQEIVDSMSAEEIVIIHLEEAGPATENAASHAPLGVVVVGQREEALVVEFSIDHAGRGTVTVRGFSSSGHRVDLGQPIGFDGSLMFHTEILDTRPRME